MVWSQTHLDVCVDTNGALYMFTATGAAASIGICAAAGAAVAAVAGTLKKPHKRRLADARIAQHQQPQRSRKHWNFSCLEHLLLNISSHRK